MTTKNRPEATGGTRKAPRSAAAKKTAPAFAVEPLMTSTVHHCSAESSLGDAARLMWDHDIGAVPVVDGGRLVGIVTDRDIAMATYLQDKRPAEIPVRDVMSKSVFTVRPSDTPAVAAAAMARYQVHRLPVVGEDGTLVGILSLSDLALATSRGGIGESLSSEDLADAARAICAPRGLAAPVGAQA